MHNLARLIVDDAKANPNSFDLSELKGKSILITGASGLVGTYLCGTLRSLTDELGVRVYAVVHSCPENYLSSLLDHPNFEVIRGDLTNDDFIKSLPSCDYIIHAAGYGQPGKFLENPFKTIKLNTSCTIALLEKLPPGGKFLFLSTSEVYSGSKSIPYQEDDIGTSNTLHPRACYIEAKRCGEAICNAARLKGINAKSARLSLAYGPGTRGDDKRVINNFIKKGFDGKINMLDHGHAKRTYCYISDATWIMFQILLNGKSEIYNLGGKSRTSIRGLAEDIANYLKVSVSFPEVEAKMEGAPEDVFISMDKYEKEFGVFNFKPLNEGVRSTVDWQRMYFNKESRNE